jgi:uncharacterized membrane protein
MNSGRPHPRAQSRLVPRITFGLLALAACSLLMRSLGDTTGLLVASSILMFACCVGSAVHVLGKRAALRFVLIATILGWAAEEMGSRYGWFFGSYTYTEVLGPRVGSVPFVIALMWFALAYIGYVIANLIVWQTPNDGAAPLGQTVVQSLLAAMVVTAYDLGADPYMVFKLKAWIMTKTDGGWFGETLQGFAGWMFVSFVIVFLFRLSLRRWPSAPTAPVAARDIAVPLAIYGGNLLFQALLGVPIETRAIAVFAMGIPLLAALCGWSRWRSAVAPVPAAVAGEA